MLKKFLCFLLALSALSFLAGCSSPNSKQLDIYSGSTELKLLHLNMNTPENEAKIDFFRSVLAEASPLEKPVSQLGYYPDYKFSFRENGAENLVAIVDIIGDRVEFYYPGPTPEASETVYLSDISTDEFMKILHSTSEKS